MRILATLLLLFSTLEASALLDLLDIVPSEQSRDFVHEKKQFQLHGLLTEQRHPKTWDLSKIIRKDTKAGIDALLSVDEDISAKFLELSKNTALFEKASNAIVKALLHGKRIYIYGCGATGRLAKQMESSFWRPFFTKLALTQGWEAFHARFPNIENALMGEMTGADRALISSLEGFEDLQLIGKLQLQDHNIGPGDVVFAITEGGETSSVIGTILFAKPVDRFFIYNNPDQVLFPFDRSRKVLEDDSITKIPLFTGPQAITGSTRMQATTSETFVMGIILEHALTRLLKPYFPVEELSLKARLLSFIPIQKTVAGISDQIAQLTDLETNVYRNKGRTTYFADQALITVFIDSTERAPTFRLFPLDRVDTTVKKSWVQVCTNAVDASSAWLAFLGRPFRGLRSELYLEPFSTEIADPFLRQAALNSLKNAGDDQQFLYDFSLAKKQSDLVISALFEGETTPFSDGFVIEISPLKTIPGSLHVPIDTSADPLRLRQHIALKMLLNAHSTAVMAKLGRVVGNTMTNVNPGNLKLIGRATFLILSHVNTALAQKITYEEANAVLFDAIDHSKKMNKIGQNAEVGLSIIRILESLKRQKAISWEEAELLLQQKGLESYLEEV